MNHRRSESGFAIHVAPGAESKPLAPFRDWLVAEGVKTPPWPERLSAP